MSSSGDAGKIIWARWMLSDAGRVEVVATYGEPGAYVQRDLSFESLDVASEALGPGFREVVSRVTAAGYSAGRWRP